MGSEISTLLAKASAAALMLALVAALAPPHASAEQVQSGNLVMSVHGGVAPRRLPRDREAPAAARLASRISTTDGEPTPSLRRIEIAFGGGAAISPRGLPVCPAARLQNATPAAALRRCGGALVGRGTFPVELRLPGQLPLRRKTRALIFNGRGRNGGLALWAHVFAAQPPVSFVLRFHVRKAPGSASSLVATVPRSVSRWVRIGGFAIELGRLYRRHGELRSYLNASCPVPRPFTAGFFSLARITLAFSGHRRLSEAIVRSCRVRS